MNSQCGTHQTVFFAVCGFYVVVLITMCSYVVKNDERARASEIEVSDRLSTAELTAAKQHAEMMDTVMSRMNDGFFEIKQRLSRIEAGIK